MAEVGSEEPRKTWAYVLAGVIAAAIIVSLSVFVISRAVSDMGSPTSGSRVTAICISQLGKVAQAQLLYAADHDDELPPAEFWIDATWKYAGKKDPSEVTESVFKCPAVALRRDGSYGYAFNNELDRMKLQEIAGPETVPLVFDSKALFRNAAGPPVAAYPDEGRHSGGKDIVVAYANGSVKAQPRK